MVLLAFMCLGVAVKGFSQFDISKTTLKVDWQMNAPFSTDFADKLSGWGMSYELGYQFTPRWEAGVFASFHTNHKYVGRQTLSLSPTESLTTDQQRSAFQVPFGVMGSYNLSTNRYVKPYIGVKAGAMFARNTTYFGSGGVYDKSWGFYVSPEIGLSETQQTLVLNGLRGQVRLQTDGQLKTGRDIISMALLGAEEFGFGTSVLIVLGCVMMRKCHANTCPVGVATQDPQLRAHFRGHYRYVVNFFRFLAQEVREYLAEMGFSRLEDIVGRTDLIEIRPTTHEKASLLDFSKLLHKVDNGAALHNVTEQRHEIEHVKDVSMLAAAREALENRKEVSLEYAISNTDRSVGAMLAGAVAKKYGQAGLPEQTIHIKFKGSAGQSFGAFLTHGISFKLEGEANDYLGKGLSGGRIAVLPPVRSNFDAEKNTIAGNTLLYGATDGEVYINGRVGERFAVRNSGVTAVVEGVGDHCCEYMTGGRVVVLGETGRNFAAGMSGGVAYVWDLSLIHI